MRNSLALWYAVLLKLVVCWAGIDPSTICRPYKDPRECRALVAIAGDLGMVLQSSESSNYMQLVEGGWLEASKPYCKWRGVFCDEHQRVTRLELELDNLLKRHRADGGMLGGGRLVSPHIGNLSSLSSLHLDFHEGNELRGILPAELGACQHLKELIVNGHSELRGTIPATFAELRELRILHLDSNKLTGTIPSFLGALEDLEELLLSNNSFTGTVPDSLTGLPHLRHLELGDNQGLTGDIPEIAPGDRTRIDKKLASDEEDPESIADFVDDLSAPEVDPDRVFDSIDDHAELDLAGHEEL